MAQGHTSELPWQTGDLNIYLLDPTLNLSVVHPTDGIGWWLLLNSSKQPSLGESCKPVGNPVVDLGPSPDGTFSIAITDPGNAPPFACLSLKDQTWNADKLFFNKHFIRMLPTNDH